MEANKELKECLYCSNTGQIFKVKQQESPSNKTVTVKVCLDCKKNIEYWQNRKPTPSRKLKFGSGCKSMSINHLRLIG